MLELFGDDEQQSSRLTGLYENMAMKTYRDDESLSNGELQMFNTNPASYTWNKTAPSDPTKETTSEFGTALHTAILEPHLFEDSILVSDIKGRLTDGFRALQRQYKNKIVLTELEYNQIKIMAESTNCDPCFKKSLDNKGACEASIFVNDPRTGLNLKIRPDKIITGKVPIFGDVKSTASLEDWRQDKRWLNPLFKFGYGFTAAYYMYVGSIFFGIEMDKYAFLVASKSASLGKYPVSVFIITKQELEDYGFWDDMLSALDQFKIRNESGNFISYESFPEFYIEDDGEVEVTFDE